METFNNILSPQEIDTLLHYNDQVDDRTDARPDVTSKHPRWNKDEWPQTLVKRILDQVLDFRYKVQEVCFMDSKTSFRLHVDSGYSDLDRRGYNVLIPLWADGPAHTVFFDNFWHKNCTTFSKKKKILPFEYNLINKKGDWQYVSDVRLLLEQVKNNVALQDFNVDDNFIKNLESIIQARSNESVAKMHNRTYDYTDITNYDPKKHIDKSVYNRCLSHLDHETVQGLTIHEISEWVPTSCIVFERTRLHCASSGHKRKIGITILTSPCS